jgi:hypothetical protein
MHALGQGLSALGRHGPALLALSLAAGAMAPPLASAAYALLPLSAFLLTLGSFLTAGLSPPQTDLGWRRLAAALAWVGLGVPAIVGLAALALRLDPAIEAGVILSVLAPPVGSAAAIAAMLGLQPRLALWVSIALTLAAPGLMPVFAAVLGIDVAIDMGRLAWRLALIIGAAAGLAWLAMRHRARVAPILPDPLAASGVAVIGLVIVGLAMTSGLRAHWANDPDGFLAFLLAALGVNLGAGLVGALLFASWGAAGAFTMGLVSGNRNVTLAWAAAGATLPVATEAYVAACVLPVLLLPLAIRTGLSLRTRLVEGLAWAAGRPHPGP